MILSDPQPGKMNMAMDAAILESVEGGMTLPTLRLYDWSPPCLSLGYNQPFSDIDLNLLQYHGWDVVRRPTGGRAILHTDELTYSVIGPMSDPRLEGRLMDSYRRISKGLYQTLINLGLSAEVHTGKNPHAHQEPICFENPSDYEITVNGKKIIGSAQARKKIGILQHGSLPLSGDLTRITEVLDYPSEKDRQKAKGLLLEKAATISSILKREITWKSAVAALIEAFAESLNLDLVEGNLNSQELDLANNLIESRYGDTDWTRGNQGI